MFCAEIQLACREPATIIFAREALHFSEPNFKALGKIKGGECGEPCTININTIIESTTQPYFAS
jgi:hypothetical protein